MLKDLSIPMEEEENRLEDKEQCQPQSPRGIFPSSIFSSPLTYINYIEVLNN